MDFSTILDRSAKTPRPAPIDTYTELLPNGKTGVFNQERGSCLLGAPLECADPAEAIALAICFDNPLGILIMADPEKFQKVVAAVREKNITQYPCPTNPPGDTPCPTS
jgi:hypothetical protein